jgi:hypothetical protein
VRPVLYFDLASPYAYLAVERAASVLGAEPALQPVLVGAIFGYRGWGSWAGTPERERNMAEIEQRARAYGLPLTWTSARGATSAIPRSSSRPARPPAWTAATWPARWRTSASRTRCAGPPRTPTRMA